MALAVKAIDLSYPFKKSKERMSLSQKPNSIVVISISSAPYIANSDIFPSLKNVVSNTYFGYCLVLMAQTSEEIAIVSSIYFSLKLVFRKVNRDPSIDAFLREVSTSRFKNLSAL